MSAERGGSGADGAGGITAEWPAAYHAAGTGAPDGAAHDAEASVARLVALRAMLERQPTAVDFFQAVRLLERLQPERAPVGGFGRPGDEVVRFSVPTSTAFPASEIQTLDLPDDGQPRMAVNFLGLTGPQGVLPYIYTHVAHDRARSRDTALRDFLDLFHHRIVSLFYRAWEKHRFTIAHERGDGSDPLTVHLADLVGLGTEGLRDRQTVRDESFLFYTGLLGPHQRSAVALEQLLTDYFGVPAAVEQFVGGWYPLPAGDQCALGDERTDASRLGAGAVAGDEVWDQQARIRVRLGPLDAERYDDFLPGGAGLARLRDLVRLFAGLQLEVELQLVLDRTAVPACALGADGGGTLALGWKTWLRSAPMARDPDDTVLTL